MTKNPLHRPLFLGCWHLVARLPGPFAPPNLWCCRSWIGSMWGELVVGWFLRWPWRCHPGHTFPSLVARGQPFEEVGGFSNIVHVLVRMQSQHPLFVCGLHFLHGGCTTHSNMFKKAPSFKTRRQHLNGLNYLRDHLRGGGGGGGQLPFCLCRTCTGEAHTAPTVSIPFSDHDGATGLPHRILDLALLHSKCCKGQWPL